MKIVAASLCSSLPLILPAIIAPCLAQDSPNQAHYVVDAVRIRGELTLTGKLSDPLWSMARPFECPYEIYPGEDIPAKEKTWVRVLYDSRYLYFGFACNDSDASAIRAHIADRDNIFQDDFVFVAIDPFRDNQRAYEFVVNPYGLQGDLMRTGNNEDASWDAVWYSKGAISDTGYTVEMAIPFQSLHFPAAERQDWSIMVLRICPRSSRYQNSWTPFERNNPCSICQGGTLRGLEGLQSTANLEALPYVMGFESGGLHDDADPSSGFNNGKIGGRVGGGVRYSPGPSVSIEGVANPDFSQVESDATQISVNTTFAIFYPEKRPFFLDGADLFSTQMTDFYSRMINNPLGAAKITSKSQHLTLAYLAAEDRNSPFIIPGEEGSSFVATSSKSFSNVVRAKYEFGTQSYVGAIGTARNFSHAHNATAGIDWDLFFGTNYSLLGQLLLTDTRELNDTSIVSDSTYYGSTGITKKFDGQHFSGAGLYTQFRRDARDCSFHVSYQDMSPTFQAQDGFIAANDLRTVDAESDYSFYPMGSVVQIADVFAEGVLHFNGDNARKERWGIMGATLQMPAQTSITGTYLLYNEELFHGVRFYGINRGELQANTAPSGVVQFSLDLVIGRFIHRVDNPNLGTGHVITSSATLKPLPDLELDLSYSRSRLSDASTGELFYDGSISRAAGIYHFTGDLFLRIIGQYDQFNRAVEIDPLLSYKLNPFTIFYAGSTHSLTDFGGEFGVRQTARQFFIKLQYLWRE